MKRLISSLAALVAGCLPCVGLWSKRPPVPAWWKSGPCRASQIVAADSVESPQARRLL